MDDVYAPVVADVKNQLENMGFVLPSDTYHTINDFHGFLASINWTEPWLIALMLCHVCLLVVVVLSRHSVSIQAAIGIILLTSVYLSEKLNEFAATNWRSFASEQYFDSGGLFISTVFSAPILFNCLIIIINFLLQNYYALKDIQHLKMKQLQKQRNKPKSDTDVKSCRRRKTD